MQYAPLNVAGNVHDWKAKIWRWTNNVENKNKEERDIDRTRLIVYFTIFDYIIFIRVLFVDKDFMIVVVQKSLDRKNVEADLDY